MKIMKKAILLLVCLAAAVLILNPAGALAQSGKDLILNFIPGDNYRNIKPGETTILHMEVRNSGNITITGISLSTEQVPDGWELSISPDSIPTLEAGRTRTVDISVTPAQYMDRGEYQFNVIADADDNVRMITSAFLRIDSAFSVWTWVGIGLAVVVVAGFVIIYRIFGRQ